VKRSIDRILNTHVGSLPRSAALTALLVKQEAGEAVDAGELHREMADAVKHVVDKQIESGVDVINDGRAAARRVSDVCAAAHEGLWRAVGAQAADRHDGASRHVRGDGAALSVERQDFERTAGVAAVSYEDFSAATESSTCSMRRRRREQSRTGS